MTKAFDDVILTWKGVDYTIRSDQMMAAICRIEEHVSLEDLNFQREGGGLHLKRGVISKAFASVLRMAGANVTDVEIYEGMFKTEAARSIINAVSTLQMMMVPNSVVEEAMKGDTPKNPNRQAGRAAASGLSRKPSRQRAARNNKAA